MPPSGVMDESILEELVCPVCEDHMCPPIFLCTTGHSICDECFKKVKTCPKCRSSMSSNARNYALEGVHGKLLVPCKYSVYGCDIVLLGEAVKEHQMYCSYARISCPFRYYDDCQWNQSKTSLKSHLEKKHALNFYLKDKQKFLSHGFAFIDKYHYIYAVIFAYDQFFRLTWELNEITGMTRWALYFLGSPENARNYSFKLEFFKDSESDYYSTPLTYKSVCISKPPEEEQKFVEHYCFYVHKDLLKTYCMGKGNLTYKITIYCLKKKMEIGIDGLLDNPQMSLSVKNDNGPKCAELTEELCES